jgi:hypothetical protein
MRQRPGGRAMRFSALEELAVDRIAFSWRARFPLATRVFDGDLGRGARRAVRWLIAERRDRRPARRVRSSYGCMARADPDARRRSEVDAGVMLRDVSPDKT